jgi:hypothetical protein
MVGQRVIKFAEHQKHQCAVPKCIHMVGSDFERLVAIETSGQELTEKGKLVAAIAQSSCVLGIDPQGFTVVGNRVIMIAFARIGIGASFIGYDVRRVALDSFGAILNGAVIVVLAVVNYAAIDVRRHIVRVQLDRSVAIIDREIISTLAMIAVTTIVEYDCQVFSSVFPRIDECGTSRNLSIGRGVVTVAGGALFVCLRLGRFGKGQNKNRYACDEFDPCANDPPL